jgi:hypothetical protein
MTTLEFFAAAAKAATSVAGGHIINSALPAKAPAPAMILASSPCEAASPFIFQFPATSGIILAAAIEKSLSVCGYQTRYGKARALEPEAIPLQLQGVGPTTMVRPTCLS